MSSDFSAQERLLLTRIQEGFPLTAKPYAALAQELGWPEARVLDHIATLKERGIIRRISAIFDTRRLGYTSTLVAARVQPELLDTVALAVGQHPGVSHNYGRDHAFNLWFTLAVPPGRDIEREAEALIERPGVAEHLLLPMLRTFKLHVRFNLTDGQDQERASASTPPEVEEQVPFETADIPFVRILQKDLPVQARPFAALAEGSLYDESELLHAARRLLDTGIMRRYGALLRHRRVGYGVNAMACWLVEPSTMERVGRLAAAHSAVSHCYERRAHPPVWPYQLYTMIHSHSEDELAEIVGELRPIVQPQQAAVLRTGQEYKKVRLRYFEPS